ncbi:MAG: beta-lactamase family protein [Planctomycetaceae bacterium]|nr:beta-lactamase family protein [Planctomycetaceae bacterium]
MNKTICLAVSLCFLLASTINAEEVNIPTSDKVRETIDGVLREFYDKYSLPGGISMAISYRERLVYAGAIGYADREHKIPLTPEHRMRVASVSKPITGIAMMKLVEEKKLNLNDEVFGETGIFGGKYGVPEFEDRPVTITVKQLLEHTAGGWGNSRSDPMFSIRNVTGGELIRTVVRDRPLEELPGTKYDYSNFGYCVLGRVIEERSGMTYESYVKEHILKPCGIEGMRIGKNTSGPDEVEYMGDGGQRPYSLSPSHMDAHGGWVAHPIELLKLLVRVDGFSNVPDILESETIKTMTTPSAQSNGYALGWSVNQSNNWWHMGGMPGTTSMMARSSEGFNWVILVNFRPSSAPEFSGDMDRLFWTTKATIQEWGAGMEL